MEETGKKQGKAKEPKNEASLDPGKKPPLQEIMEVLADHMNGGPLGQSLFRRYPFPVRAHVEEDSKGARRVLIEGKEKVLRHASLDFMKHALLSFTARLPKSEYWAYRLNPRNAQTICEYWLSTTTPFTEEIYPIAQKNTDHYTYHRLDFTMEERPTEVFDYLMGLVEVNKEPLLAYLGALFDPKRTLQMFLWITGQGGEGKGALTRFLARIFADSYTSISTESKEIDKYWQASLVGKRLAVCTEVQNTNFINSSIFKQVTGGDAVAIREMREKPYMAKLNTMFLLAANADPALTSEGSARRRAIIAKMSRKNFQYIENFEEKLWEERAGIVHKCWNAWLKVRHLQVIPSNEDYMDLLSSDTEEYFQVLVDRYFIIEEDAHIYPAEFRGLLDMEKYPMKPHEYSKFKQWLERTYGVRQVAKKVSSEQVRKVYKGLRSKHGGNSGNLEVDY